MRIVLTGAGGFLGWHTRLRLHALTRHVVLPVTRETWGDLPTLVADADAVIHVAGLNRADDHELVSGNLALARDVAAAVAARRGGHTPIRIVYADSIQHGNGSPYGAGKAAAADVLLALGAGGRAEVVDVRLPNVFGEHGRPQYNSFVATFIDATIRGERPSIADRPVGLLHVQHAAQALIDALTLPVEAGTARVDPGAEAHGVQEVWDLLQEFKTSYDTGEFPDLSTAFRVALFNSYRAALFPAHYPIRLTPHTDSRGTFVETVRCRGGESQTSFSTTVPGFTRGDHYHLSKIERFAVISGRARMSLRRMFTDETIAFDVDGAAPMAVDMPVGWAHNITNTGDDILLTQFWSHELFRPHAPDTFPERVFDGTVLL